MSNSNPQQGSTIEDKLRQILWDFDSELNVAIAESNAIKQLQAIITTETTRLDALAASNKAKQPKDSKSVTEAQILKCLNGWNFQYHVRHCKLNPLKYGGTDPYEGEEWNNEDLANLLAEEVVSLQKEQQS